METIQELFKEQLKDLYSAEKQLTKALPAMAKKASSDSLKQAIEAHLEETEGHVSRIEEIAAALDISVSGKKCKAMEGLIEEGKEALGEFEKGSLLDAAIIAAAQRVEHYEISSYGTIRTLAEHLGYDDAVETLQQTLNEEGAADQKLTEICEGEILPAIPVGEEDEESDQPARTAGKRKTARA